ncbi:hypothetical protein [Halobaculum magnesiiphilum]|uniref:Uncharacterized protein n=1 Tax=Halobaculum magnesiiphilum TaxID=1017351 RepID=A0A8T8WFS7_9EURY|nr:hypothetical protein [Halobaculum magnesiiphilum]QZP38593.1 hypothetical protein K6T50_05485 [Halobaculum magnesiiphilum]
MSGAPPNPENPPEYDSPAIRSRGIDVRTLTDAGRDGAGTGGRSHRPGGTPRAGAARRPVAAVRPNVVRELHRRLPIVVAVAVALALVAQAVSVGIEATVATVDPAALRVPGVGTGLDRLAAVGALAALVCESVAAALAAYGVAIAFVRVAAA